VTKTATAALNGGVFVKLNASDASNVQAAGASDTDVIGVTKAPAAAGEPVAVVLLGISGSTVIGVASAAIAAGAKVYLAADGKVRVAPAAGAAAQSVVCVGVALTPALYAGDNLEIAHRTPVVETIAAAE